MRIDVVTIFPRLFDAFLTHGMVEQARKKGSLEVRVTDLRAFTDDRHRSVDDRPYGGGPGMLLKPEPVFRALDLLEFGRPDRDPDGASRSHATPRVRGVLLSPQGQRLDQATLQALSESQHLVVLCGRYEGFDERISEGFDWTSISIGDYVLSGGEVPALVIIEGIARLLPGVLGHGESHLRESFSDWAGTGDLDHPHYTRPPKYRGRGVPPVLLSGDHGEIEAWRRSQSAAATRRRRCEAVRERN